MSILVFLRVNENGVLLASVESQTQPRHPRILVAHHEVAIREVLDQILREGGCEVCTVESSAEAVSQAPHFRPDTLIIEPIMPELDGFKAAKQIAQATNCRVLFLESRSSSVAERKEWLNGARQEIANCDLLLMPFDREDVLETVFGHRKPEKEQTDTEQWYKGPDGSWYIKEKDYSLAALVVVVLLIGWVALVFYAPHQKHLTAEEQVALSKARTSVAVALYERLIKGDRIGSELEDAIERIVLEESQRRESPEGRRNLVDALKVDLSRPSDVLRVELRGGHNLVIYLRKSDFDTVLYPDRKEFVKAIGKAWCDNTGENSHWLLPSVYISDIRTGEDLASHSCVFD